MLSATLTHGNVVLSLIWLASSDHDAGASNSVIDIHDLTEKWATVNSPGRSGCHPPDELMTISNTDFIYFGMLKLYVVVDLSHKGIFSQNSLSPVFMSPLQLFYRRLSVASSVLTLVLDLMVCNSVDS